MPRKSPKSDKIIEEEERETSPAPQKPPQMAEDDLDAILAPVTVSEAPEPKEKGPKDKKTPIKPTPKNVELMGVMELFKMMFSLLATFFGKHWELDKQEAEQLGRTWKGVIDAFGPEWLFKYFPLFVACIVTLSVIGKKVKIGSDLKEKEKKEKARAEKEERMKQERENEARIQRLEAARLPPPKGEADAKA